LLEQVVQLLGFDAATDRGDRNLPGCRYREWSI
jgi:hypothetical protein